MTRKGQILIKLCLPLIKTGMEMKDSDRTRFLFASPSTSFPSAEQLRAAYPERTPFESTSGAATFMSEGRK